MRRGTIVLLLFIIVAGAIIGYSLFLRNRPPLELTVAVHPMAEDWVRAAVDNLNASEPVVNSTQRVHFTVVTTTDVDVWKDDVGWSRDSHPDAWIPSSSVSVTYTPSNLPFTTNTPSVARTVLVWGGYASRVDVLTADGTVLDWSLIAAAAQAERWDELGGQSDWNFIKLAFAPPNSALTGLAVLLSGAASFHDTAALSRETVSGGELDAWLQPIINSVPNFQTLGSDIAQAMARGPSTVEIAILPENQWLLNLDALLSNEGLRFSYPAYQFVFDFPVVMWNGADTPLSADARAGVTALGEWLLAEAAQTDALDYGLRPANGEPTASARLFAAAQPYGIALEPDYGQVVQAPSRIDAESLMQRFR